MKSKHSQMLQFGQTWKAVNTAKMKKVIKVTYNPKRDLPSYIYEECMKDNYLLNLRIEHSCILTTWI